MVSQKFTATTRRKRVKTDAATDQFKALDKTHQQILEHLDALTGLLLRLDDYSDTAHCRQKAKTIEAYFSETARDHHAEEERIVFPDLLLSEDAELVRAVHMLKQDHGWIEQNWLELAPQLRAIADGEDGTDMAELKHNVEVFLALCRDHILLEETLIYPQAKARMAAAMTSRSMRLAQ